MSCPARDTRSAFREGRDDEQYAHQAFFLAIWRCAAIPQAIKASVEVCRRGQSQHQNRCPTISSVARQLVEISPASTTETRTGTCRGAACRGRADPPHGRQERAEERMMAQVGILAQWRPANDLPNATGWAARYPGRYIAKEVIRIIIVILILGAVS
jgi:hypothetical protein